MKLWITTLRNSEQEGLPLLVVSSYDQPCKILLELPEDLQLIEARSSRLVDCGF
jgi:hypothetical protein